ncbi:ATP-dependent DNA helicase pif1, partial [Araneus ventricosus]
GLNIPALIQFFL